MSAPVSLRAQVEHWLAGALETGVPERVQAAAQFGLGERAFSRQLLAEGGQSFAAIARQLGFSEASAFDRAFRRWTGCAPGDWQARAAAATQVP